MMRVSNSFESMASSEVVQTAGAWLATYAVHSTILILGVWLVCRGMKATAKRVSPAFENHAWRLALVGGVITATVQLTAGVRPAIGAFEVGERAVASAIDVPPPAPPPATPGTQAQPAQGTAMELVVIHGPHANLFIHGAAETPPISPSLVLGPSEAAAAIPSAAAPEAPTPAPLWPAVVVALWLVGAGFALVRLGIALRRLRRQLDDRKMVVVDPVLDTFLQLCSDARVRRSIRLSHSPNLPSPIALRRDEIVLSTRCMEVLGPKEMRGVLAHEIAHIERRDPLWLCIAAAIETVLFLQPLNRLARKGMQESAELLCDDWAISKTGDQMSFARSLADMASHGLDSSLVPGMMTTERPLTRRVRRALDAEVVRTPSSGWRPGWIAAGIGALALVVFAAPGAVWAHGPIERGAGTIATMALAAPPPREQTNQAQRRRAEREAAKAGRLATGAERQAERARRQAEKAARRAEKLERKAAKARRKARKRERGLHPERLRPQRGHGGSSDNEFTFEIVTNGKTVLDLGELLEQLEALEDADLLLDGQHGLEALGDTETLERLEDLRGLEGLERLEALKGLEALKDADTLIIREGDSELFVGEGKVIIRDGEDHLIIDGEQGAVDIRVDGL